MAKTSPIAVPFRVAIDTNETAPYQFKGLLADANQQHRPLAIRTVFKSLGRYPESLGDYSVEGFEDCIAVERKSKEDAWATVLGWPNKHEKITGATARRWRFEQELKNLSEIAFPLIVVEANFDELLADMPAWGVKPAETNAKIFARSINAYIQDYRVPWAFYSNRQVAEKMTFRYLQRFWRDHNHQLPEGANCAEIRSGED